MAIGPYFLLRRPPTRIACGLFVLLSLVGVIACNASRAERVVAACTDHFSSTGNPMLLLIGTDGIDQLCQCTVAKVYERVPDADERADLWVTSVESRLEKRGLLGMVTDSAWFQQHANELDTFGAAFGPALAECTRELVQSAKERAESDGLLVAGDIVRPIYARAAS